MDEPGLDLPVEEVDQRREESRYVEQTAGLAVKPELRPAPDFEQLLERADAAGQRNEPADSSPMSALRACIESTTRN